jgi:hypothetical protein
LGHVPFRSIHEERLVHFDTNAPPKHESSPYPIVNTELPKLYPCAAFCGSVGSGKTVQMARLVSKYIELGALDPDTHKPVMQRCIVFSPSIDSNPVFSCIPEENLAKADMISGYTDSRLTEIWDEMKLEKRLHDKYKLEMQLYTQMSGMKDDLDSLPLKMQQWLEELDFKPPKPQCKYPQGVIYHLILDDCLGASCFKSQGKSVFTNFCLARRHAQTCIYICTQSLKQVPRRLRQSVSLWVLFKYAALSALSTDFYPEISALITEDDFKALYNHAVTSRHDFLVADLSAPPERVWRKGWTHYLQIK